MSHLPGGKVGKPLHGDYVTVGTDKPHLEGVLAHRPVLHADVLQRHVERNVVVLRLDLVCRVMVELYLSSELLEGVIQPFVVVSDDRASHEGIRQEEIIRVEVIIGKLRRNARHAILIKDPVVRFTVSQVANGLNCIALDGTHWKIAVLPNLI